jgi:hypothetical protein
MNEFQNKIKSDYIKGTEDEKLFRRIMLSNEYNKCEKSGNGIDKKEGWDYLIEKDNKTARVQVKGLKECHKKGYVWIEIKRYDGKVGWLYRKAEILAVMVSNKIYFYLISKLREIIKKNVNKSLPILKAIPKKKDGSNDYEYMRFRQYNGFNRREDFTVIVSFNDIDEALIKTITY